MIKSIIKSAFIVCALFALTANAEAQNGKLFKKSKFNGYAYSSKTGKVEPDSLFKTGKGTIVLDGKTIGYVMSNEVYKNFKLTAQFRWMTESDQNKKRNSGLMYYVAKDQEDALWPSGIQYQIKTNSTGNFILLKDVSLTVHDTIIGPGASINVNHFSDAEKEHGVWNDIVIEADGDHVKQYLNGVLVNEATNTSVIEGRILFQYEGSPIEFKAIKVKRL
ncbi:3-keto-disaccharide hydrolase [Plebeiibacterium sediminum]|uniref:DUF1080 domain-containing protein n=1 Tax=Plebeiibacterium sediminum TaxID=2992112 RepID=A0AAE3M2B2_9BACT|nr:DUF1080 domain-containing protein [Plebeiobacterium sediminum]MCW3785981.1 DUF1080 domain-containing protein [Plebeiobacterium sediminum]